MKSKSQQRQDWNSDHTQKILPAKTSNNKLTKSEDKVENRISNFPHRQSASLAYKGLTETGEETTNHKKKINQAYEEAVRRKKRYKHTLSIFKDAQSHNERNTQRH